MNVISEEDCEECLVQNEIIDDLKKQNEFLKKLVYWGHMDNYVFDSLNKTGAIIYMMGILGDKIEVSVSKYTTIRNIKSIMETKYNIPWHRNTIIQNCQKLENHRSLLGLGIPANAVLQYSVHPNTTLYPPFEELTQKHRKEIIQDKFILDEHALRCNSTYHTYLHKRRSKYNLDKADHVNHVQLL